jgi:hypothetical protein
MKGRAKLERRLRQPMCRGAARIALFHVADKRLELGRHLLGDVFKVASHPNWKYRQLD